MDNFDLRKYLAEGKLLKENNLDSLIDKYGQKLIDFVIRVDQLTSDEAADVEYLEDRIEIHLEEPEIRQKYLAEGKLLKEEENLEGKTINLVRTLHTTGTYNNETGKMDKVTQTKNMTGTIGDINSFSGSTGFWLMNDEGKKLGYVMYDPKIDKFIEGESSFYYEYEGQSSEDQELLNQFKGQSVSENTLNERISLRLLKE
jgi:hypothetical protein